MSFTKCKDNAVSEVGAGFLIIILVVVLGAVAYLAIFGNIDQAFVKKSAYIAATAEPFEVQLAGNPQIVAFLPRSGDPFYFTGQTKEIRGTNVTLKLISPDGKILYPNTSSLPSSLYGKNLYIYPKISSAATQCEYEISDSAPTSSFRPMIVGCWTLQTIDMEKPVLIASYPVRISEGRTSLPSACGFVANSSGKFYRSDCTAISQTVTGSVTACTNGTPGNMPCSHFDGSSYVTLPNDPTLSFTGDELAISMWINPSQANHYSPGGSTSNWYTLMGKGQLFANNTEYDNYQLTQIGDQIYFEWTDSVTNKHYHIMTNSAPITANQWNQVTVTITDGVLSVYTNCIQQPVSYYKDNYPGNTVTRSSLKVNLSTNDNNFLVGKQNSANPAYNFYFKGDLAGVSVYDRGLSSSEIASACTGNYVC